MTGAFNRRHILEVAQAGHLRARRRRRPFSVAVIDVDSFKAINDTHGHPAGDLVLREFAAIGRAHARTTDSFARYGGDEFMFVLPETPRSRQWSSRSACARPSPRRASLVASETIRVAASIGVAALRDEFVDELLARANGVLYAGSAKAGTRSCPPESVVRP